MIIEKTFTIETRLNQNQNQEIIDFAREFNALYGIAITMVVTSIGRNQNLTLFCRKNLTSTEEWQVP